MKKIIRQIWLFLLGSFIGFILETIWCLIKNKKIESRKGLIYGLLIPIYGIATIIIDIFVKALNLNSFLELFITVFLICGVVEYISSLFQEKCFGTKSWDYSEMKYHINGRVNLVYLLAWSTLGIFYCKIYPKVIDSYMSLLNKYGLLNKITLIAFILLIFDITISILAAARQKTRRRGKEATNKLEVWLDKKYNDKYLKKIYANSVSIDNKIK